MQALDLNGAVREAHYSTSGNATTWKFGGTWEPFTDLRFRATKSRDFRAPTLFDLFAGAQAGIGAALDPHTNVNGTFITRTSGNPDLKPETSDNETVGLVYEPHFLPHFAISVDYYQVSLQGAISTLSPLQTLQDCALSSGTAPSCVNIKRPLPYADASAANYPTEVDVVGTNIAAIKTHGIDVDASYRSALGGGELTLRMYASYVGSFQTQRSASQPVIDYAGYNNTGSGGVAPAVPRVKGYLSVNYGYGPLSVFVQEDVIGPIKNGPTLVFNEPATPVHSTTDLTLTYSLDGLFARPNLFLTVNNLFNRTPPLVYGTTAPGIGLSTILPLYDTTGRYFTLGARFQF